MVYSYNMEKITIAAQLISSISYFYYGASCLLSKKMILEFERYGMSQYRVMTGVLQILTSIGLIAGFLNIWLVLISALGLALQMLFGLVVRVRLKDSITQALPALFFCALNIFIFYRRYLEL